MTDNLVQKVEEKVMVLLDELERLRKEVGQLKQENTFLKSERGNHTQKLQSLISLLDILDVPDNHVIANDLTSRRKVEEVAVG